MVIGLILVVIGVVFFARALGYLEDNTLDILWPLLLIILGFTMLSHRFFSGDYDGADWHKHINWNEKKKKGRK